MCRAQRSCLTKERRQSGKSQLYICLGVSVILLAPEVYDTTRIRTHGSIDVGTGVPLSNNSFRNRGGGTRTFCPTLSYCDVAFGMALLHQCPLRIPPNLRPSLHCHCPSLLCFVFDLLVSHLDRRRNLHDRRFVSGLGYYPWLVHGFCPDWEADLKASAPLGAPSWFIICETSEFE